MFDIFRPLVNAVDYFVSYCLAISKCSRIFVGCCLAIYECLGSLVLESRLYFDPVPRCLDGMHLGNAPLPVA